MDPGNAIEVSHVCKHFKGRTGLSMKDRLVYRKDAGTQASLRMFDYVERAPANTPARANNGDVTRGGVARNNLIQSKTHISVRVLAVNKGETRIFEDINTPVLYSASLFH